MSKLTKGVNPQVYLGYACELDNDLRIPFDLTTKLPAAVLYRRLHVFKF